MLSFQTILLISISLFLGITICDSATRIARDDAEGGLEFSDMDTSFTYNTPVKPKGFIQMIMDWIKRLFGWDDKTAVVREDGTVEWVDNGGGGGFIARIGRKILSLINSLLSMFMGTNDTPKFDMGNLKSMYGELEKDPKNMRNNEKRK